MDLLIPYKSSAGALLNELDIVSKLLHVLNCHQKKKRKHSQILIHMALRLLCSRLTTQDLGGPKFGYHEQMCHTV